MKEISEIIKAYEHAREQKQQMALATVVHLEGSSYRRPGARMLITEDGQMTGAISGGCLEGDALRKALLVLNQQQSKLVTYDTSDEEDASIGVQLGCNGVIQVLFEPIATDDPGNPIQLMIKALTDRQPFVLATLFSLEDKKAIQQGTRLLVEKNGEITSTLILEEERKTMLQQDVTIALKSESSLFKHYQTASGSISAFVEYLKPVISLFIIGAGNDVIPMVEIATSLGWKTTVIDGRPSLAKKERFPGSCEIILSKPEQVLEQIRIDLQTVFALMTHNYNYDQQMLKALVQTDVQYIGMLGPKKKLNRMLEEFRNSGMDLTTTQLSRIYSPAGIEIGAETPEEIALSIIAEIKTVLAGRSGQFLRDRSAAIHSSGE